MTPDKSLRFGHHDGDPPKPRKRSVGGAIRGVASKLATDIAPSVIATVLGAYIVTHYVNTDKQAAKPAAQAQTATATPVVTPAVSQVISEPAVTPAAPTAENGPIRIIPGTTTVPAVRTGETLSTEQPPGRVDDGKSKSLAPATRHSSPKEKIVAVVPKAQPAAQQPVEAPLTSSPEKPTGQATSLAGVASATGEDVPVIAPAQPSQAASAIAEDALEKARKALERAKAENEAEKASTASPDHVATPALTESNSSEPVAPSVLRSNASEGAPVRAVPARPVVIEPVAPLPPPVIVAQPQVRSRSADALPAQDRESYRVDDEDRPIPPASIPDQPAARGGFLLIR
jgi:hypothetical protein